MTRLLIFAVLFQALSAWAAERHIATLTDPTGDDNGDGSLVYPQRSDFQPGDLDLTTLRISRDGEVYRFEASFRNPIRDPATAVSDFGAESMADFARLGFYTFNLDIYIDQDRVRGSGNTLSLPGRKVRLDEAGAWEKAIILTPRPELMRRQLIDTLVESEMGRARAEVTASVDRSIYFVPRARVRSNTVAFEVPASFLVGGRPDAEWSITAFVTGAKTRIEADVQIFGGAAGTPLQRLQLGVMQPAVGRPRVTFGYSGDRVPLPVVDLLAVAPQQAVLAADSALPALVLSAAAGGASASMVAPSPDEAERRPTPETDQGGNVLSRSWDAVRRWFRGDSAAAVAPATPAAATPAAGSRAATPSPMPAAAPAAAGAATAPAPAAAAPAPQPMQKLLEPARPAPAAPAAAAPARPSIADRLKTLKELLDQKLIDEAEYKQQRQRILNEL
jgi:hypothetical protein